MTIKEKPHIFISHITDEAGLAATLQERLNEDFLGLAQVFASSDEVSIAAGRVWLDDIKSALKSAHLELILCSEASVSRPWLNFEAGAGWIRGIDIIPICHTGLLPEKLPMPMSTMEAVVATHEVGLKKLYGRIAEAIGCNSPSANFAGIISSVEKFERDYRERMGPVESDKERKVINAKKHMYDALRDERYEWRSLNRLAIIGAVTASEAMDILRADPNIRFDLSDSGLGRIVQLSPR